MSWSVSFIGEPEKVAQALEAYGATLEGASKEEYEKVAPPLAALVRLNFQNGKDAAGKPIPPPTISVSASGHGYKKGDALEYNSAYVSLQSNPARVV
jgi:hypothetical protein